MTTCPVHVLACQWPTHADLHDWTGRMQIFADLPAFAHFISGSEQTGASEQFASLFFLGFEWKNFP